MHCLLLRIIYRIYYTTICNTGGIGYLVTSNHVQKDIGGKITTNISYMQANRPLFKKNTKKIATGEGDDEGVSFT